MTSRSEYDVFLCHNSKEKEEVEKLRGLLKKRGIRAWLDKHDFEPFRPWQEQLEEIIPQIKSAAIFIGSSGIGPWSDIEMREFIVEFAERKIRMGLVVLPGCPDELIQSVPRFMKKFHWVDFRQKEPDPMEQLIWGITGQKPKSKPRRRKSRSTESLEVKPEDTTKLLKDIQTEELRVEESRERIAQIHEQIKKRQKFYNPQLEAAQDWLSEQKRSRLAEKAGKEALKAFPEVEQKLSENSDAIKYFYEDIEDYLKLIYYSLITERYNLLREPSVKPFLSNPIIYVEVLRLVKSRIPPEIIGLAKEELEARLDYLSQRLLV